MIAAKMEQWGCGQGSSRGLLFLSNLHYKFIIYTSKSSPQRTCSQVAGSWASEEQAQQKAWPQAHCTDTAGAAPPRSGCVRAEAALPTSRTTLPHPGRGHLRSRAKRALFRALCP